MWACPMSVDSSMAVICTGIYVSVFEKRGNFAEILVFHLSSVRNCVFLGFTVRFV